MDKYRILLVEDDTESKWYECYEAYPPEEFCTHHYFLCKRFRER